ncbi:MAG: hypothetical protein A2Z12_05000 [Actinobacteria bacterium RBG_16_68_21]|nr:MAG: hypothetical protein A2Z12_05000 [Actinobacteria bacterium RBG_16_68_21]
MIPGEPTEPTPISFRRRASGRRRWLGVVIVVVVLLLLSLRGLATFWTDYLWFDSVGFSSVWTTLVFSRVMLVLIATAVAFALMFANLVLADRLAPRTLLPAGSPDEEIVERFQGWVGPRLVRFRLAVAGFFGLLIGLGAGSWWEDWLLYRNHQGFGIADPVFNKDVGFYVFDVPFYRDLFGWAFQFFLIATLVVAALHYLNGGIQVQPRRQRVASGVKVHLSVLIAVLALLKAGGYWLDRYDLVFSSRGAVVGATYTDVHAQLPALNLLIGISVVAAVLLLVNIRMKGWTLPAAAVGLWLVTSIALGGIWPAAIQRFSVQPDEINKELPYVARNIDFTRQAYGLDTVEVRDFAAADDLSAGDVAANGATISNVRLWDPSVLLTTYRQLQELRPFYQFLDVDVDRYMVDGVLNQVMLSGRELDDSNLPDSGWVNKHLVFTHGFGAVVSPANTVTVEGQPDFLVKDINPADGVPSTLEITQPRIYFGEALESGSYVYVGTKEMEVDFPVESGSETVAFNSYDGAGGIQVGSIFRRAAFALRFADVNTLISGQITSDSRVLMVRNLRDILTKAAPFLYPDADPYLVVVDGHLVWVQDMYTVTDRFPYSTPAGSDAATANAVNPATGRLSTRSGLPSDFNYIRNSVKATVDAYDGTVRYYVVDDTDPLIRSYRDIFPSLFSTFDEMPTVLRDHLRYPEDLFRVQSDLYTRYHVTDSRVFFNNGDPWEIARDPSTTPIETLRAQFTVDNRPMVPYYLLMQLPDEDRLSYLAAQPFTAATRPNMVSFLVAKSDADSYGDLVDFELPRDSFVDGPGQVGARINQDTTISAEFTLLGQEGSAVIQGNMLVVPIRESFLYVQPIYLSARSGGSDLAALPEFKRVIVVFGGRIEMRNTLAEALSAVFGESSGDGTEPPLPTDVLTAAAQLLQRADEAYVRADTALRDGDLGTYQSELEAARNLVDQARNLLEQAATTSTTTTTTAPGA